MFKWIYLKTISYNEAYKVLLEYIVIEVIVISINLEMNICLRCIELVYI